jgi:Icc-related predicted phosphoesterase
MSETPYDVQRQGDRRQGDRRRRTVRIAAVGDFHSSEEEAGTFRAHFASVNRDADVLVLAGDLTRRGTPAEMKTVVAELSDVTIPIVAVLGNHDYESGQVEEGACILRDRGIHLLDGDAFQLDDRLGIAGAKGFMGGFGRRALTAFGEPETKAFVADCIGEVQKLELALQRLHTPVRVALLHYAPVVGTVVGEPEQIYPFLGTDRLADPLDRYGVDVCFHGHAHIGTFRGETTGGVPVFNVAHALLKRDGIAEMYYVHEIPILPEEEARPAEVGSGAEAAGGR